ncbi:MAG: glutamine--fructose-6-phosphate transaminase (isomerizing), partial [Chloroflexi bacterium]|nr:glutamine--fructose-6-phosphate transaminase (isomerizing) [Chloroflexota bacterium]
NGIIVNYQELRARLTARGHGFRSETDTEALVHLIEDEYHAMDGRRDFPEAVRRALRQVRGAYAIVAFCRDDPDLLVGARQNAPLVVGLGEGENYVASDIAAMLAHTRTVVALEDGEIAAVRRCGASIRTLDGAPVNHEPFNVEWDDVGGSKGGFPHFVLKEIHEQPEALSHALIGRIQEGRPALAELAHLDLSRVNRVALVGCGSAFYASLIGKYLFEGWARLPVELSVASEFRYAQPVIDERTLCVFVSQSGETADTLASFRLAQDAGAMTVALTNTQGSSLARGAGAVIFLQVGPEIGVVATKTFTAQTALLTLMALYLAMRRGTMEAGAARQVCEALLRIPQQMESLIRREAEYRAIAERYAEHRSMFFIGRHLGYPVALEGALKVKEISYIHAEGYPAGELKHGPIAMLEPAVPVVAVATQGSTYEKVVSNMQEVRARGAKVLAVATEGDDAIRAHCDDALYVPATHHSLTPLLAVVPLQFFAYHIAARLGRDVDQPRNLAKSVTVE